MPNGRRALTTFALGGAVGAAVCALVIAYAVRAAQASGIPSPNTLAYSGTLLSFGVPDNATHNMIASIYVSGTQVCTTGTVSVTCASGQFSIPLPSNCTTQIQTNANASVEVTIDGTPMGSIPLTAVPYAAEAGNMAAGGITGVVAVANGGTGSSTQNFVDLSSAQTVAGAKILSGPTTIPAGATLANAGVISSTGQFIRTLARAGGDGPSDDTDSGVIASRVLTYTKTQANTALHISWQDNLRVNGQNVACQWELKLNGASCASPGPMFFAYYVDGAGGGINNHRSEANFATCNGLAAGTYTIQVYVAPVSGYAGSDCYTGWPSSTWEIDAEEVY